MWIAFVFVQSLYSKFSNLPETQHIFGTIGLWMTENFFAPVSEHVASYGGYTVGGLELLASLLLLVPGTTRTLGALLAIVLMTGSIFFHLATPLGIEVQGDGGLLFYMACSVWICGWIIIYLQGSYTRRIGY